MILRLSDFKGQVPTRDVRLLPKNYAQKAVNVNLDTGNITSIKGLFPQTPSNWTFVSYGDAVPANVSGVDRLLVSGLSGMPEARQGGMTRRWGVVTPTTALTATFGGTAEDGAVVAATVSYVYTFVTAWGEESAPSPASMPVDVLQGQYVSLSNFQVFGSGNDITHVRVYRTATGDAGGTEYQLAPVSPAFNETYDIPVAYVNGTGDQIHDRNSAGDGLTWGLGDMLMTEGWDPLPNGVHSGIEYANGVYAALKGKTVYLSVPGYYYAFPSSGLMDYTFELEYEGVGLGVFNQQLVVCTEAYPEIISGADSQSATRYQLPYQQPCLSKRSIVSTPMGVFYVSPDGGFLVNGEGGRIVTSGLFTREQWNDYPLDYALCAWYNQKIYVFFASRDYGFALDFQREDVIFFEDIGQTVSGLYVDPEADQLYLNTSGGWQLWEGSHGGIDMVYQTALQVTHPTSFSSCRVDGTCLTGICGALTLKIWADGDLLMEKEIEGIEPFRIPGGNLHRNWYLELIGTGNPEIYTLYLAHSMEELKSNA
jgi:hypothetical protein